MFEKGTSEMTKPDKPCWNCGCSDWWQRTGDGHYICAICHPEPKEKGVDYTI